MTKKYVTYWGVYASTFSDKTPLFQGCDVYKQGHRVGSFDDLEINPDVVDGLARKVALEFPFEEGDLVEEIEEKTSNLWSSEINPMFFSSATKRPGQFAPNPKYFKEKLKKYSKESWKKINSKLLC